MAEDKPKAVVNGKASASKSLFGRIAETFTLNNLKDARNYIIKDVIVPSILDMLYDGITRGAAKLIYKDNNPRDRKRKGFDYSGITGITRLSDGEALKARDRKRDTSVSGIYDYNEIELRTRADAELLLDSMCDYLEFHEVITVADMYSMANYNGGDYTDNYWGWSSLAGAHIERSLDGWVLKLPEVKNIKEIK